MNSISLNKALQTKILTESGGKPVISYYSFSKEVFSLYERKSFRGKPIGKITSDYPSKKIIDNNLRVLISSGVLTQISALPVYEVSSGYYYPSSQQIICELNPFCYLSYLTAMEWHHLTDRIPKNVHVTTCTKEEFQKRAKERSAIDFPGMEDDLVPVLKHRRISKMVRTKNIKEHSRSDYEDKKTIVQTGGIRVSSVGETFLDMLRYPDLCGGVSHVLEVFTEHANSYLPSIVKAIDKKGSPIDKVRAGYVLEERLKLRHRSFDKWKTFIQRGGSRKFVPSSPYEDAHSEKWCISLNFADG